MRKLLVSWCPLLNGCKGAVNNEKAFFSFLCKFFIHLYTKGHTGPDSYKAMLGVRRI
jgi:hypothetical protein